MKIDIKLKQKKSFLLVILLIIITVCLALIFLYNYFSAESSRQKENTEFFVFQTSIVLTETYINDEPLYFEQWPGLIGFGLYNENGESVFQYGSAPKNLLIKEDLLQEEQVSVSNSSMTVIRRLGALSMMGDRSPGPLMRNNMMRMHGVVQQFGRVMPQNRKTQSAKINTRPLFSWIELDISESMLAKKATNYIFLGVSIFFIILVLLTSYLVYQINYYKKREQEITRLVQLGEAARVLAHEIKSPLGIIRVQVALLKKNSAQEFQRNLEIIDEESIRLAHLADQIREFLHTAREQKELINVHKVLLRCKERYGNLIYVDEAKVQEYEHYFVKVQKEHLFVILDNLIRNAIEAKGEKLPLVETKRVGKTILFCVRDFGIGISAKDEKRLFELFYTTKAKGSGIGLALSQKYAHDMNGKIKYKRMNDIGTEFCVQLPFIKGSHE